MSETMVRLDSHLMGYLVFGLILIRCSGLVVFAPFFGAEQFPRTARIAFAAFLAMALYPVASQSAFVPGAPGMPSSLSMSGLAILAIQEISIGLTIGFFSSLAFMGVQLAGSMVGQQIGFSLANIIDPLLGQEISIIGFFKFNLALLVFLVTGMHIGVLIVLRESYHFVQIGELTLYTMAGPMNLAAEYHAGQLFVIALQLAAPILLVMLLNSVIEGFITRTMPQLNIMVLGLPLRVMLGLTALLFAMPILIYAMEDLLMRMVEDLGRTVEAFKPIVGIKDL